MIEITIRLMCYECGNELWCEQHHDGTATVEMCDVCVEDKIEKAFSKGCDEGFAEGYEIGREEFNE